MNIRHFGEITTFDKIGFNDYFVIPTSNQIKEVTGGHIMIDGYFNNNTVYKKTILDGNIVGEGISTKTYLYTIPNNETVVPVKI